MMPKAKWNLNTIYISERLQESLRPISRCAMTSVVAPMGYGKTTAVNWYLAERAKAEALHIIRISVYSANLAIFWKSTQEAFARAGFPFLRDYPCPTDAAGGGLLVDDLCHALAGDTPCYLDLATGLAAWGTAGTEMDGRGLPARSTENSESHLAAERQGSRSPTENEKRLPHTAAVGRRDKRSENAKVQGG